MPADPVARGYVRVSKRPMPTKYKDVPPDKEPLSLPAQREQINRYFEYTLRPKGVVWGGFYEDSHVSGKVPMEQREAGMRLILDSEPGDHIIFAKLDRGFRRLSDCVKTLDHWQTLKVAYHLLDLQVDSTTAHGQLLVGVIALFAEFERKLISIRTKEALDELRAQGRRISKGAPWGWKWQGKKAEARLVPDVAMREIGKHIVDWHLKGWTFDAIYKHMKSLNIKHPYATRYNKDNGCWGVKAIKNAFHAMLRIMAQEKAEAEQMKINSTKAEN